MRRALVAVVAAICLAAPVEAKAPRKEPLGPICVLPPAVLASVLKDEPEAMIKRLDGGEAAKLLAGINATGDPTSYTAQSLVVRLFSDHVAVLMFSPCATQVVMMGLKSFGEAMSKSKDDAVPGKGV